MIHSASFGELEQRGDVTILPVSGRLSSGVHDLLLREKAEEIKKLDCRKLVADIRALESTGSSGISFLVELYTSTTKHPGGRFVLAGPSERVRDVLEMTRLTTILVLTDDLDSALNYCARSPVPAQSATGAR